MFVSFNSNMMGTTSDQELLASLEHLSQSLLITGAPESTPAYFWIRVAQPLVFCVLFCISLFVLLFFFLFGHCIVCSPTHGLVWFMMLTPLSTLFQLYRGGQLYWWTKPEYPEKGNDLSQVTVSSTPCHERGSNSQL